MKNIILLSCLSIILLAGCAPQNKTQSGGMYGAAGGAAVGALLGQAIGRDTEGTLYGAAIGAAVGGLSGAGVGKMMDNQEEQMRQALADSEDAAVRREGNLLAITLKGDVTFDTNSAIVRPGLYSEIDRISSVLRQYPQTVIRVEGHTDSTGTKEYNVDLSQRRAKAVENLFMQRGVETSRLVAIGYVESMPVATNETETGRQRNRRVEIKVAPSEY